MNVPRFPDALMTADLPDWVKLVWLTARKLQGSEACLTMAVPRIAEALRKDAGNVRTALARLSTERFGKRDGTSFTCLAPDAEARTGYAPDRVQGTRLPRRGYAVEGPKARTGYADPPHTPPIRKIPVNTSPSGREKPTRAGAREAAPALPDCIDPEVWAQWEQHRREKKQRLTPTSTRLQLAKLERWHNEGHDVNEIIQRSIANGWTGLFPRDADRPGRNGAQLVGDDRRPDAEADRPGGAVAGLPRVLSGDARRSGGPPRPGGAKRTEELSRAEYLARTGWLDDDRPDPRPTRAIGNGD